MELGISLSMVRSGGLPPRAFADALIRSLGPAAWFRADTGVTVTGAGISQIDDLSGNARHLLDPGTTRPIYLPYTGTQYLYLPGVAGNYASTPDSVPASITGDIDIRVKAVLVDWTPAAVNILIGKAASVGQYSYNFYVNATTGRLVLTCTVDGSTQFSGTSSASPTVSDGAELWVRATRVAATGKINFYTSSDGVTWTILGTEQTSTTGNIFDSTAAVEVGTQLIGTNSPLSGKVYRALIKSGIDGATVVDFNPADADGDGDTSFVSSTTGETWTVNVSGSLPAQIVGRAGFMTNGTSHYLNASFTLNQPSWFVLVGKRLSWTINDVISDGFGAAGGALQQTTTTPKLTISSGSSVAEISTDTLNVTSVLSGVFNGASSSLSRNLEAAATGNAGANNMSGVTLGAIGGGAAGWANAIYNEYIVFPIAPSAAQQAAVINAVNRVYAAF